MVLFPSKNTPTPTFLFVVSLAGWWRRVEVVSMHGVIEVEGCLLCWRCLHVWKTKGNAGMCWLLGLTCWFKVCHVFLYCPPRFFIFFVPKWSVWTSFVCAIVWTSACILEEGSLMYLWVGVFNGNAHFMFFGLDVGATVFFPPKHLFTCLHEKWWMSLDRGNQRV